MSSAVSRNITSHSSRSVMWKTIHKGNLAVKRVRNHWEAYMCASKFNAWKCDQRSESCSCWCGETSVFQKGYFTHYSLSVYAPSDKLIELTWRKGEKRAYGPQCTCNEWKIKLSRERSTLVARAFSAPETLLVQMVSYCWYSNN